MNLTNDDKAKKPFYRYGLLGKKLSHSFSPYIHSLLGNKNYKLYELAENDLEDFILKAKEAIKEEDNTSSIKGLNVTIPYKINLMSYCDYISNEAREIGCINTLHFTRKGLFAYNTDYAGFKAMLTASKIDLKNKNVLIFGDGATSLTAQAVALDSSAKNLVKLCRKSKEKIKKLNKFSSNLSYDSYDNMASYYHYDVILNTTSVGMYPRNLESLCDLTKFTNLSGLADVIYNPHRTKLLLTAADLNIPHTDGLPMLVYQAIFASDIFFSPYQENIDSTESEKKDLDKRASTILREIRKNTENIALVGMPGSGKSSIGRLLAEESNKIFIDIDEEIEKKMKMPISQIFKKYGQGYFRQLESEALEYFCKENNMVISTGGGCVTVPKNYHLIKQNARIYNVKRPLEKLDTRNRPLSISNTLTDMYRQRRPMYEKFADKAITNDKCILDAVMAIKEDFNEFVNN